MDEIDGCPLCDKPVVGETALHGHLEFGHDIADPAEYLARLRAPVTEKKGRRSARRAERKASGGGGKASGDASRASADAGGRRGRRAAARAEEDRSERTLPGWSSSPSSPSGASSDGLPEIPAAPATPSVTMPSLDDGRRRPGALVGVAVAAVALAVGGYVAWSTLLADGDDATSAGAESADGDAPSDPSSPDPATADFRAPFLLDAAALGCTVEGDVALQEVGFRFSGARDITFDGTFYPGESGDGPRTTVHRLPAGTSTYLDEVVVTDPSGGTHAVAISPPLRLPGC